MVDTNSFIALKDVKIDDLYWNRYTALISEKVLPYQWNILNDKVPDAPPSYCLANFRIAAGDISGERKGTIFQDSDAAKWIEAVAYSLAVHPDTELEQQADQVIDLICRSQQPDGYLNTYYTLVEPEHRWQNLCEGHELYCAGHLIEAAVAYYQTTGKTSLLNCVCKFADLIAHTFGPAENQLHGYPGHPEIELALVKLYHVTQKQSYLDLAKYFIDERGTQPNYFLKEIKRNGFRHVFTEFQNYDPAYSQSHMPLREQMTAEGHAVRAVYLYCAMADIAQIYNDEKLLAQCRILWNNMVKKRMFITGSIGSSGFLERFTADYDLPNDSNYSETCASIGLTFLGFRMAEITHDSSYIDICERALYNTVRSGIAMEGNRYFYVNPLEVWPDICLERTSRAHVKAVRQKWFDVACCPTNIARTFASLGKYIYSVDDRNVYVNLFIQNTAELTVAGKGITISMKTAYPKDGKIKLHINGNNTQFKLHIRIPSFAENAHILFNGIQNSPPAGQYYTIASNWNNDIVELQFDIIPHFVYSNPLVRANCGKTALIRGPEVYCLEECDNGSNLAAVFVDPKTEIEQQWKEDLLGGTTVLSFSGYKQENTGEDAVSAEMPHKTPQHFTAIPYGSWGNRKEGEMIVWLHSLII